MEVGVEAACSVVGKALGLVSGGVLEAWAASIELGPNIRALGLELLCAQGMLNNARGRGRDQEMQNPALAELLQELQDLGYRANDVLDELDYFRMQDELDGTYHAADEHEGGCLSNCALNARHTARAIANMLGFSKCSSGGDSHGEPAGEGKREGGSRGPWPCLGLATPSDDEEEDDASQRGVICGGLWPCRRASAVPPANQEREQGVDHGCMGRLASGARNTIHTVGKHIPCHSLTLVQNDSNSNVASSERQQREQVVQIPKLKFNRVEISQTMKEIIEQLNTMCAKVSRILSPTPIQKIGMSRPTTTSVFIEPKFYGREDKTSKIIHDITKGEYCDKALTVLPIVGPGGIGKTTLTQYIHNHEELKKHFEVKLWVCVSVKFNAYRLTQEIADKLSNEKRDSPDKIIEQKLESKRFLLVVDDMWNFSDEDEWKRFLVPFTKGQTKGSVILVTTRFPAVAQIVKTVDHHIDLKGLDHEIFKELFLACVFGDKETPNDHIELLETADMILKKLKGSPLAAKTVGRLLRNNLDLDHWTTVLESREWESREDDHDIMPALKLSFDYLPFHLQQCFTYCALFPEDYRFGREELIHFWIGLDVLHSHSEHISIEDIGLRHLNELVNHGFLKMEEEDGGTCYVIHDLLHELALKVSARECLNIYSSSLSSSSTQMLPSIRHLSISLDDSSIKDRMTFDDCKKKFSALAKRLKVENLYSLMLFGEHQVSFVKTFSGLFSKAKSLRVIFLSGGNYSMEDLLPNYLNLVHLRYLRLSGVLGPGLSKNISRYYHLRVLHVHGSYQPYDLTRDISNLIKLRHFLVLDNGEMHSRISKVGSLKWLQGLQRFVVKKESQGFELSQIGNLPELKGSLRIENLEKVESREEAVEAKLMHKKHLLELLLNWDIGRSNKDPAREEQVLEVLKPYSNLQKLCIKGQAGVKCPSWLGVNLSVKSLEYLCLDSVAWKTFPPIGKLWVLNEEIPSDVPNQNFYNLRKIELVNLKGVRKWVVDTSCQLYSCLETLIIEHCSELMELSFSNSTCGQNTWFPKLRVLEIEECPKLSSLPPVPWTRAPCKIWIGNVGLVFEMLNYEIRNYDHSLYLEITGKNAHQDGADEFWMALDFDNLTELKCLRMNKCPPLPLDRLKMLSSIKDLSVSGCNNAFWPVEEGSSRVQFQLPVEKMSITNNGASGKELTQVLSCMPKLLELSIWSCNKITTLGVVEQQEKATSSVRRGFPRWVGGPEAETQVKAREEEVTLAVEESILLLPPQLQKLVICYCEEICLRPDDSVGLQGLCSLSYLYIWKCPKFFSSYLSSSSSFLASPFPTSLQELYLYGLSLTVPPPEVGKTVSLSNLASLTVLKINECGDLRGFWRSHLPRGCLTQLYVTRTPNFFIVDDPSSQQQYQEDHGLSSSSPPFSVLQYLKTDDAAGVFAAPICSLLSSSLTELFLLEDEEIERFTEQQEQALQLLTALQELNLFVCHNLQCLPASGLRGLPNLKRLRINKCSAIVSLPKGGLPNSLQELQIRNCSTIRTLEGLPSSLQQLEIYNCPAIRTLGGLPNSLQKLEIDDCPAIRALPKDGLPNSLQELVISRCPAIRAFPKDGLPRSLRLLDVSYCKELKGHCRKLIGTIPIIRVSD